MCSSTYNRDGPAFRLLSTGSSSQAMYRALDPAAIIKTSEALSNRIAERFPDRNESRQPRTGRARSESPPIASHACSCPYWPIRIAVLLALVAILGATSGLLLSMPLRTPVAGLAELLQALEAAVQDLVFLGISIFFLFTVEGRFKRRTALRHLHELQASRTSSICISSPRTLSS